MFVSRDEWIRTKERIATLENQVLGLRRDTSYTVFMYPDLPNTGDLYENVPLRDVVKEVIRHCDIKLKWEQPKPGTVLVSKKK